MYWTQKSSCYGSIFALEMLSGVYAGLILMWHAWIMSACFILFKDLSDLERVDIAIGDFLPFRPVRAMAAQLSTEVADVSTEVAYVSTEVARVKLSEKEWTHWLFCFKHVADDWILLATALRLAAGAVQDPLERSALWSLRGMVCLGTADLHGEHRSSIDEAIPIPVEDTWKTLQEDGRSLVNLRTAADCLGVVHHRLSWCDHKDADLVRRSRAILLRLLILLEEKS